MDEEGGAAGGGNLPFPYLALYLSPSTQFSILFNLLKGHVLSDMLVEYESLCLALLYM